MKVTIEKALICDVLKVDYENNTYYKLIVYSQGALYRISIDAESVKNWTAGIGETTDVTCTMSIYDGKSKFKIAE